MDNIQVTLGHGRAGKLVRTDEETVISKLDKLIKQLEDQASAAAAAASSQSGGNANTPSKPMEDSMNAELKGPGNVSPKDLGAKTDWGNLPPKEREEALQALGRDLPSHYRDVIEEYFRKLARERKSRMHLFASLLLATSTVSAGIPVELQPTEGEPRQVLLDRMDAEQLMVHTAETTDSETVPANALRQIRWPDAPAVAAAGSFQITLTDGSVLTAESYTVANGQAQIGWAGSKTPIAIPTDRIRAVRLGRFDAAIEKSWQELLARTVVADVVAVLRKNQTLDNVQGVLQDVTDEVVKFQFEGDSIDVRRTKVVGIAYYRPQTAPLPPERGTLTLTDGSSLRVDQLTAATDNSQSLASIRTVGGTELSVPVTFLRQFDLAVKASLIWPYSSLNRILSHRSLISLP